MAICSKIDTAGSLGAIINPCAISSPKFWYITIAAACHYFFTGHNPIVSTYV